MVAIDPKRRFHLFIWETTVRGTGEHKGRLTGFFFGFILLLNKKNQTKVIERGFNNW